MQNDTTAHLILRKSEGSIKVMIYPDNEEKIKPKFNTINLFTSNIEDIEEKLLLALSSTFNNNQNVIFENLSIVKNDEIPNPINIESESKDINKSFEKPKRTKVYAESSNNIQTGTKLNSKPDGLSKENKITDVKKPIEKPVIEEIEEIEETDW